MTAVERNQRYRERHQEQIATYRSTTRVHVRWKGTARQRYIQQKQEAITLLGGICCRCGCDDIRCLEIDHIIPVNGDRSVYGAKLYRSIVNGGSRENLQVLCANCHAIKTYEDSKRV